MSDDLRNVDVAIVGGGIVGCAVALAARRIGLTAAIFERGRICGEASSVAAGLICGQYDADYDTPLLRLRLAGRDVFPEFAQLLESLGGAPVGYLKGPTMGIAWTDEQRKRLLTRVATQQEAELDVEFLEPEEARRREPLLAPGVAGAALYPDGAGRHAPMGANRASRRAGGGRGRPRGRRGRGAIGRRPRFGSDCARHSQCGPCRVGHGRVGA